MSLRRTDLRNDTFRLRLAALYAAIFAFAGIQMPFLPVWLAAKGLDARDVGLVLATAMIARPLVVPVASRTADHFRWSKGPLAGAAWIASAAFLAVAVSDGFALILVTYALSAVPQALVMPLTDAYALRGLSARGLAYGPVRMWGSIAFILANLGGGFLLERLGALNIVWMLLAALVATALTAMLLSPAPFPPAAAAQPAPGCSLWHSLTFVAVVVAASLLQASHAVYYGFASLQWAAQGMDGLTIGALWSIGVIAEIVLFAGSGRFLTRLGPFDLLALGATGAIVRWGAMAFDPPAALLPPLQILHALTFGATHLGAMHALARLAAHGRNATAQGDYSALAATTMAVMMSLSGLLVTAIGSLAYLAMAALAAAAGVIIMAARRRADAMVLFSAP